MTGEEVIPLDHGWLFGPTAEGALLPDFDDSSFERVTIPHANATFPWQLEDRAAYQYVSIYRKRFSLPEELRDGRVFVRFEGVMAAATVAINGHRFKEHRGGYTPFSFELTPHLKPDENVLAVEVDSRRSRGDVPPFGGRFPNGDVRVDFDTFGGIQREVSLRAVPPAFIADLFARPADVLDGDRHLDVRLSLNGAEGVSGDLSVEVDLLDGGEALVREWTGVAPGSAEASLALRGLGDVELWDVESPRLYGVAARLLVGGEPVHERHCRIGFRDAAVRPDGFFLNGRRLKLFGLSRHELFPYVGGAMPARAHRRDAEILKRELGCNVVRTAHYPHSPRFLDACDELGLMVWEELPGWQHVGDEDWKAVSREHARAMILRDRNHPAVILWGVRINESEEDHPEFYDNLDCLAKELDGSRQTTGAYNKDHPLRQDVRGRNDYQFPLRPPSDEPYLISEAVGQKDPEGGFRMFYRRTDPARVQQLQAERHAQVHDTAASDDRYAGVIAWLAFDYNSPHNPSRGVKTPGVSDLFRIPKPAALFYRSQRDPSDEVVLEPAFYWDFGSPQDGPGEDAMVCSNCERLEVYVDGRHHATAEPDRGRYPNLPHPPFFLDLAVDGTDLPELRIDGFLGGEKVVSRSFSADPSEDRLLFRADDGDLLGDGIDAVRLVFRAVDRYGAPRPRVEGDVSFEINGPGAIVGDNPFDFGAAGGAGAVWVRAVEGGSGKVQMHATHPTLGSETVQIPVKPGS